jgi:hypothetical protein
MSWRPAAGPRRVLAAALAVVALAGCGVQAQQEAQPLPSGALQTPTQAPSPTPTPSPTPSPTPTVREVPLFFVSGPLLEAVPSLVPARSADGVIAALAAGPPVGQQAQLRTLMLDPLTSAPMFSVVAVTPGGQITLQRADAFLDMPATDQVLLVGQVVHSMAEVGLSQVVITDPTGALTNLALPDGRSVVGPVTADDYATLLAP